MAMTVSYYLLHVLHRNTPGKKTMCEVHLVVKSSNFENRFLRASDIDDWGFL